jgi:hypothetical protein
MPTMTEREKLRIQTHELLKQMVERDERERIEAWLRSAWRRSWNGARLQTPLRAPAAAAQPDELEGEVAMAAARIAAGRMRTESPSRRRTEDPTWPRAGTSD